MSKQVESQLVANAENPKTTGVLQRVRSKEKGEDFQEAESPVYKSRFQANMATVPVRQAPNKTGLPDRLKAGVENLSGYSLDDVRVHYNSSKPAQLQALAYTQGTEIHVGPGQERHLPHEAWHVVQQMQGRVKPTMQMKGVQINDDEGLEREADAMGRKTSNVNGLRSIEQTPKRRQNNIYEKTVRQQKIVQLLSITTAISGKVTESGADRLEVPIEVTKDDGTSMTITLNTSYKKHMVEAYTSGGIKITANAANMNTIATLNETDFKKAFEDFAFLFAKKIKGQDPNTFDPSAAANELTTNKGLNFHSDYTNLGAEVHCFPTATAGNAVVLSRQEFLDLKLLTNIAYHTSDNLNTGAINSANRALLGYNASLQIQGLFTAMQIATVGRLVRAKILKSQENLIANRDVKRDTGILKGKIDRGEVIPVDHYR